ncbi:MAG: Gfo/Idh/MocA family oxidoreductase [Gemmiger sp.]|nr:Gfo/Idh/MocA family oxidoreductase [Gemmiger sp.]
MKTIKIGFVGVGAISGIYVENITNMFDNIEVYAVCDLVREKAAAAQEKYKIPKLYDSMEELFADPAVDIVLNITRPYEHYAVTKAALHAGKPVYSEKPLAATVAEGAALVALAQEKGLLLGGAPDTFLGAGIQTCKKLIEDGYIGTPIGAAAAMVCHGHESWHPDPAFYYQHGGGPMMDMGPYYITALVNLLGPVKSTVSVAKSSFPTRTITSKPHYGETIEVKVPTYVNGILNFENGAVGTITTTFDVYYPGQARLEIYGSKGTLFVPDPNTFGGPVKLLRPEDGEVKEMPLCFGYKENSRARGLSEMAEALAAGKTAFSCDCTQTFHVLSVLEALTKGGEKAI